MGKGRGTYWLLATVGFMLVVLCSAACQEAPQAAEFTLLPTHSPLPLTRTAVPPSPAAQGQEDRTVEVPPAPTPEPTASGTEAEQMVTLSRAELAQRLGVPEEQIGVTLVEAVEWPDAGLGCPQPGTKYAQTITPGYRVILEVDGQAYEVHTNTGPALVLCEKEDSASVLPPGPGTDDPGPEPLLTLAKEDLARRFSVAEAEIDVLEAESVVWPDAGLGCPQSGMAYAQAITPGYRIVLTVKDQLYEYHTDQSGIVVLCADSSPSDLDAPSGSRLPILVEMLRAPLSPDSPAQMPPKDDSPTGAFAFSPADRLLFVQPSIEILPTTEVLVGLTTAGMPGRPYFASELYQIPSSQVTPLSVVAIEADSGALTLAFADQVFELSPGESRSFKQKGVGELSTIELTTISNHGRPAAIDLLPAGPTNR